MIATQTAMEQAVDTLRRDGVATLPATDLWTAEALGTITATGNQFRDDALAQPDRWALRGKPFLLSSRGMALTRTHPLIALLAPVSRALGAVSPEPIDCFSAEFWIARPVPAPFTYSQHWHRDHECTPVLKAFLHLSDTTAESGPLEYVVGSHRGDLDLCAKQMYAARDAEMPAERIARLIVPAGTVVLADTSGIHRGGRIRTGIRLQAVWAYLPVSSALWKR